MQGPAPWVKRLLVANIFVYLATFLAPQLADPLMFVGREVLARPWILLTYAFLHGGLGHLFGNMLGLYFFGSQVERHLGARRFLSLYGLGAVGGAALTALLGPSAPMVGASGALFAIMVAFAMLWPTAETYLFGVVRVRARTLVLGFGIFSLIAGFTGMQAGVAHFGHLGGAAAGWAFMRLRAGGLRRPVLRRSRGGGQPAGDTDDRFRHIC